MYSYHHIEYLILTTPVSFTTPKSSNPSKGELSCMPRLSNCSPCSRHKTHPGRRTTKTMLPDGPAFSRTAFFAIMGSPSCTPTVKSRGIRGILEKSVDAIVGVNCMLSDTTTATDDPSNVVKAPAIFFVRFLPSLMVVYQHSYQLDKII